MNLHEINLWERLKEKAVECQVTLKLLDTIDLYDEQDHDLGRHYTVEEAYAFLCGYEYSRCAAKLTKPTPLPLTIKEMNAMKDEKGFIRFVVALEMENLRRERNDLFELMSEWVSGGYKDVLKDVVFRPIGVDDKERVLVEFVGNIKDWLKENQ